MKKFIVLLFIVAPLNAQILYEEHFSGGSPSLQWYPFFDVDPEAPDTMQVVQDSTAPDGDGYVGFVGVSFLGMPFAGDPNLRNYSVEAWVYLNVTQGADGPYQGLGFRVDYTNMEFFNFIADLDNSRRLRLAHITSDFMPVTIKEWSESEIPGGLPTADGWHKMKIKAVEDSFWCYFDGQELPGCPYIYGEGPEQGYFGVYYWVMSGVASLKVDSIIVKQEPYGVGENAPVVSGVQYRLAPNPFVESTTLEVSGLLSKEPFMVFNSAGRLIRKLNPIRNGERFLYIWRGHDESGRRVAPGIYYFVHKNEKISVPVLRLK